MATEHADLVVVEFVSVDGVIQAPGGPDEDPDSFEHGGWTREYFAEHNEQMAALFATAGAFVLGRRTFQIFAGVWPSRANPEDPIATALNGRPKYVASTTLTETDWAGTTIIDSDLAGAARDLKTTTSGRILVVGSSEVAQTLWRAGCVDEFRLIVHPVVLGRGKRLFADPGAYGRLRLVDATVGTSGLAALTYRTDADFDDERAAVA